MIPFYLTRYFRPRPGRIIVDALGVYSHFTADSNSGSTIDNINEMIPTFEDVDSFRESYIVEQAAQELAAHVFMFAIPAPVKLLMEAYSFYDYFNE